MSGNIPSIWYRLRVLTGQTGNSFTSIRLFAAFLVLWSHASNTFFGLQSLPMNVFGSEVSAGNIGVWIFLAISGFVNAESLKVNSHFFLLRRLFRIVPGLAFLILSTLIISYLLPDSHGPKTFTEIVSYLLNIFVYPFDNNPSESLCTAAYAGCNMIGPIWTLCYELTLYIVLSRTFAAFNQRSNRNTFLIFQISSLVLIILVHIQLTSTASNVVLSLTPLDIKIFHMDLLSILTLAVPFFLGSLYSQIKGPRFFILVLACIILVLATYGPSTFYLSLFFCTYLTLFLGEKASRFAAFLDERNIDLSYGIYLWHFPIQMLALRYFGDYERVIVFSFSVIFTSMLAGFVFFYIERPFIRLSKKFKQGAQIK